MAYMLGLRLSTVLKLFLDVSLLLEYSWLNIGCLSLVSCRCFCIWAWISRRIGGGVIQAVLENNGSGVGLSCLVTIRQALLSSELYSAEE